MTKAKPTGNHGVIGWPLALTAIISQHGTSLGIKPSESRFGPLQRGSPIRGKSNAVNPQTNNHVKTVRSVVFRITYTLEGAIDCMFSICPRPNSRPYCGPIRLTTMSTPPGRCRHPQKARYWAHFPRSTKQTST